MAKCPLKKKNNLKCKQKTSDSSKFALTVAQDVMKFAVAISWRSFYTSDFCSQHKSKKWQRFETQTNHVGALHLHSIHAWFNDWIQAGMQLMVVPGGPPIMHIAYLAQFVWVPLLAFLVMLLFLKVPKCIKLHQADAKHGSAPLFGWRREWTQTTCLWGLH